MPVGVWGVLHGLCFRKVHNLPTNLGLEVEFPLCMVSQTLLDERSDCWMSVQTLLDERSDSVG